MPLTIREFGQVTQSGHAKFLAPPVEDGGGAAIELEEVQKTVPEFADPPGPSPLLSSPLIERRLQRYANVEQYQSASAGTGCVELSLIGASIVFDLSTNACNGVSCPSCFHVTAGSNEHTLTLGKCSSMLMGKTAQMGQGNFANGVQMMTIINSDNNKELVVIDGQGIQTRLRKNTAAVAACTPKSGDRLQFVSSSASQLVPYTYHEFSNSCPIGSSKIATEAACRQVAAFVGYPFLEVQNAPTSPSGCFLWKGNGGIHYNTDPIGAAAAQHTLVCAIDGGSYG